MPIRLQQTNPAKNAIILEEDVDSVETSFSRGERRTCLQYLRKVFCWRCFNCFRARSIEQNEIR